METKDATVKLKMKLNSLFGTVILIFLLLIAIIADMSGFSNLANKKSLVSENKLNIPKPKLRKVLSLNSAFYKEDPKLIKYGRELIVNTATYLGPKGKVAHISNGMNCQNCHLEAGTKAWGNNYGAVASTYPKFRERSGTKETIVKRVNDCIERSLNGKSLDSLSREMKAIVAYIKFVGQFVPKDTIPKGSGIWKLNFLTRATDSERGRLAYEQKCITCHQQNGEGLMNANGKTYIYPPLWGKNSFNQGAGLFRISRMAGYIKVNMPLGATWEQPQLSDEEAWDIAAFINSQPRPTKDLSKDWPNIAGKPFDHPFGPYADSFTENQHKYGPFQPIDEYIKVQKKKKESINK